MIGCELFSGSFSYLICLWLKAPNFLFFHYLDYWPAEQLKCFSHLLLFFFCSIFNDAVIEAD